MRDKELGVITKTYDLVKWSCQHTSRFPRNHRFVSALLPVRVLLLTVSEPPLAMPPLYWAADLPDRVLSLTVTVPLLHRPPPNWAELSSSVLLLTVSLPTAALATPPP